MLLLLFIVLSDQDYPLPCEYDNAYEQAQVLVFETDLPALNSPEFAQKIRQHLLYPEGQSLLQKLRPETIDKLRDYLISLNIPFADAVQFKPGMLMSVTVLSELKRQGINVQGVDQYYSDKAIAQGKQVGQLETPEQQISFIANLGVGDEDEFVSYLLESAVQLDGQLSDMTQNWRAGDIAALSSSSKIALLRSQFPQIFSSMLTQRNNAWLPQIEKMLYTDDIEYVLVGALHMAEDVGLLAQLKAKGYQVEQLDGCAIK